MIRVFHYVAKMSGDRFIKPYPIKEYEIDYYIKSINKEIWILKQQQQGHMRYETESL